jgi:hypothetical protein
MGKTKMMKTSELRIGNWVEQPNDGVTRVTAVLNDLQIKTETGYVDKYCRPIPLTEEWLLKFGFEKVVYDSEETGYGTDYELEINEVGFLSYSDDFSCALFSSKRNQKRELGTIPNFNSIKTVHGLQNLYFALTGEELELT